MLKTSMRNKEITYRAALFCYWMAIKNVQASIAGGYDSFDRMSKWQKKVRSVLGWNFIKRSGNQMEEDIARITSDFTSGITDDGPSF